MSEKSLEEHARTIEAAVQAAADDGCYLTDDHGRRLNRYGAVLNRLDTVYYLRTATVSLPRDV